MIISVDWETLHWISGKDSQRFNRRQMKEFRFMRGKTFKSMQYVLGYSAKTYSKLYN